MMKKIIALSASNNPVSINHDLLLETIKKFSNAECCMLRLTGLNLPVYNEAIEAEIGIPEPIYKMHDQFKKADGFIIAIPEHNGLPPVCFKNILDWLSRISQNIFQHKPVLLISTSPGMNGGSSSLHLLKNLLPRWGGKTEFTFSLGNFHENFSRQDHLISKQEYNELLTITVQNFEQQLRAVCNSN
jgi:chromate reductase, NAD(P)H dehydrogenase (quinone)